ncbi:MAG: aminoacetone oxidase family FAD-binding enzyme [Candidatus Sumerlaeia bacterium]|nr:aminoacetone oxidase family FAD-binding enzyme [Candidatus Sumerlaeia bacterium]
MEELDIAIIGGGAAGLTAAAFAGEAAGGRLRIAVLDGARKLGAKILVSGGGRCNVTHRAVTPKDYWGGPQPMVRSVLRAFDEHRTVEWMRGLGVELKTEETGKLFPVTDSARTVLDALLGAVERTGAEIRTGCRVDRIEPGSVWAITMSAGTTYQARCLIMATGGLSLPKSGSDGWGLQELRRLGHAILPTTAALSPLVLRQVPGPAGAFAELSGVTIKARLRVEDEGGRELFEWCDSLLFTHFGLSGPTALNASRHYLQAAKGGKPKLFWGLPEFPTVEASDQWLRAQAADHPKRSLSSVLAYVLPERAAGIWGDDTPMAQLPRERRRQVAESLARLELTVQGDRGYAFAETTAGGVSLREIDPSTMESRILPGLHLCGEMIDVDGRLGGFNFQWAWASGYLAGRAAVKALLSPQS